MRSFQATAFAAAFAHLRGRATGIFGQHYPHGVCFISTTQIGAAHMAATAVSACLHSSNSSANADDHCAWKLSAPHERLFRAVDHCKERSQEVLMAPVYSQMPSSLVTAPWKMSSVRKNNMNMTHTM